MEIDMALTENEKIIDTRMIDDRLRGKKQRDLPDEVRQQLVEARRAINGVCGRCIFFDLDLGQGRKLDIRCSANLSPLALHSDIQLGDAYCPEFKSESK